MISQLTAVEDKISDANILVKKKKKNCENENKLTDNEHDKHITTPEFNKLR